MGLNRPSLWLFRPRLLRLTRANLRLGRSVIRLYGVNLRLGWAGFRLNRADFWLNGASLGLGRPDFRLNRTDFLLTWANWLYLRPVVWFVGAIA